MKPSGDFSLYQKIWDFTREQLSVKYPFFRKLLWNFSFKESEDTETAGTDGRNIYFNPDFVIKASRNHPRNWRSFFCTCCITACSFISSWMCHRIADSGISPVMRQNEKRERDPMKIYQEFQNAAVSDSSSQPDSSEPSAEAEPITPLDDHNFWKYTDRQKFLETIRQTLGGMSGAAGMGLYGNSGRGSAPGNQVEELSVEEKGKYDFHHFLRRFAVHREEIHTDAQSFDYIPYIFGLDHYGNIPLIEYLEYQEVTRLEELVIAIDTSGSCSADTVRRFMEETYGILSDQENFFRKMNLYIIQCDCFIQDVAHITCEKDWQDYLQNLRIHGRSGTDFRPVFEYVEKLREERKLKNLKGLLYFTDGDGIYPEKATDYETAFVFYKEKAMHQKVPAWAVKLYLDAKKS